MTRDKVIYPKHRITGKTIGWGKQIDEAKIACNDITIGEGTGLVGRGEQVGYFTFQEIIEKETDIGIAQVKQAIPDHHHVGGGQAIAGDIEMQKAHPLRAVFSLVGFDQRSDDIAADIIHRGRRHDMPHPVEITAGRIEQALDAKTL